MGLRAWLKRLLGKKAKAKPPEKMPPPSSFPAPPEIHDRRAR